MEQVGVICVSAWSTYACFECCRFCCFVCCAPDPRGAGNQTGTVYINGAVHGIPSTQPGQTIYVNGAVYGAPDRSVIAERVQDAEGEEEEDDDVCVRKYRAFG